MKPVSIDIETLSRWESLLARIEQSGDDGTWVGVDESLQDWQDLKAMANCGIVFHCGLRAGGKEAKWHVYEKAREYFARVQESINRGKA